MILVHLHLTVTNYTFPSDGGLYDSDGYGFFQGDYTEISGSTSIGGVDLLAGYFHRSRSFIC